MQIFRNAFVELKTCSNYCGRAVANRAAALSGVWVFTVARIRVYIIRNLWISKKIYDFCGYESVTIFRQQKMDNMSEHIFVEIILKKGSGHLRPHRDANDTAWRAQRRGALPATMPL